MRALLVEDSERLQLAITKGFANIGIALDVVGDGGAGLSYALKNPYDVVILDLMLPGIDGLTVLRRLREEGSDVHVLILTARTEVPDRVAGLQAGADDYLVKPFEFEELVARVQALARRKYRVKRTVLEIEGVTIDTTSRRVSHDGAPVELTKREYMILEYLAYRRGEAVTRIEIEDHIYGGENLPMSNAVDSAVCTLRSKLARDDGRKLIQTVHGVGYMLNTAS